MYWSHLTVLIDIKSVHVKLPSFLVQHSPRCVSSAVNGFVNSSECVNKKKKGKNKKAKPTSFHFVL